MAKYQKILRVKMALAMILFLFHQKKITFGQMKYIKKIKMDHRFIAFQKLKKKLKFDKLFIFSFINL